MRSRGWELGLGKTWPRCWVLYHQNEVCVCQMAILHMAFILRRHVAATWLPPSLSLTPTLKSSCQEPGPLILTVESIFVSHWLNLDHVTTPEPITNHSYVWSDLGHMTIPTTISGFNSTQRTCAKSQRGTFPGGKSGCPKQEKDECVLSVHVVSFLLAQEVDIAQSLKLRSFLNSRKQLLTRPSRPVSGPGTIRQNLGSFFFFFEFCLKGNPEEWQ